MKKLLGSLVMVMATVAILGIASRPVGVRAEDPNPQPGLDSVPVRLCIESFDPGNRYCDAGEVVATQNSATRSYPLYGGGQITLPGTFQFFASQLQQPANRAIVFGPIQGSYGGFSSAWIWGSLWQNGIVGGPNFIANVPTEIFRNTLGSPGAGLDFSRTNEFSLEYAFQPLAAFVTFPYYVALYLDETPPGYPFGPHPGIGGVLQVDGQVWGLQTAPPHP